MLVVLCEKEGGGGVEMRGAVIRLVWEFSIYCTQLLNSELDLLVMEGFLGFPKPLLILIIASTHQAP